MFQTGLFLSVIDSSYSCKPRWTDSANNVNIIVSENYVFKLQTSILKSVKPILVFHRMFHNQPMYFSV